MSSASRRFSPAVGNQCQYCSEARKPISRIPASMVGTDHSASMIPPGGDVEGAAPLARRPHSDGDRRRVDEGQERRLRRRVIGTRSAMSSRTGRPKRKLVPRSEPLKNENPASRMVPRRR